MSNFFKKFGKMLFLILSVVVSLFIVVKIRKAIAGKVKSKERTNFRDVPGEPDKIRVVKDDGSTEVVKLPEGWKFKDVKAVGVAEGNKIIVEVIHKADNKRDLGPVRDDNALDALCSRIRPDDGGGT